ncbi:uncharacterized protein LOC111129679 [Crassostrea virginica]
MGDLTESQREDIKSAFTLFDKDNSGFIDAAELKTVLQTLKQNPTDKEVDDMIAELDKNGNKKIEYDEFEKFMANKFKKPDDVEEEMRASFKIFDKDGNGTIDAAELRQAMKSLGETMTDEEVDEMIKVADVDSDGKVNYQEFVKIMISERSVCETSSADDSCLSWLRPEKASVHASSSEILQPIMAEYLTEEQLREMKLIFNMFDTNANGVIDAGELERVLHAMNQNPTPEEMEEFLVELDPEGTGEITFEAFLDYAPSRFRTEDEEMSMVREAFRVFDKDGSGYITLDEAKDILQRGENSISDEDLEDFFNQSDLDKDGRINYEEIRDAFEACDHDGDGTVDAGELKRVMRACGQNASTAQLQDIINDVDHNGNGSLEFSEFVNLMKDIYKDPNQFEEEIKEAFRRYDKDGNGVISQSEFKHLISSFDDNISDEDVQDLISRIDIDKDGNISYDAFAKLLCGK